MKLSLLVLLGLLSTACSTFRKNEYVAIGPEADRSVAQTHEYQPAPATKVKK